MNIINKHIGIIIIAALFLCMLYLTRQRPYRQIESEEVEHWKNDLQLAYFKSEVYDIRKPDNRSRLNGSIYMSLLDSSKLVIPTQCEYLKFKKKYLVLDAVHMNISTGPAHRIKRGDIIEKHSGSDTLYVLTRFGELKYYFFLFDGIAGPMRMPY